MSVKLLTEHHLEYLSLKGGCICLSQSTRVKSGTLANSEDPDVMLHKTAFHQGLHCFLRLKQPAGTEKHNVENSTCDPLNYKISNPLTNCINMYGKIHQNTKS